MKFLFTLVLTLVALNVSANEPKLVWCHGCSETQMENLAISAGLGTVYVGDTVNKTVSAYLVHLEVINMSAKVSGAITPKREIVADGIAPNQQLVDAVNYALAFYNTAPVGWQKHINVNANDLGVPSVYNIINAGPAQNTFVDTLNSGRDLGSDVYLLTGWVRTGFAMFSIVDLSASPSLSGTINFPDGSHIDGYFDNATGKIKLDLSSARDSHNNNIPYRGLDGKIHDLGGDHDFNPNQGNPLDENNFRHQLGSLGVPISIGTDPGAASGHGWACTESTDGTNTVYSCQSY